MIDPRSVITPKMQVFVDDYLKPLLVESSENGMVLLLIARGWFNAFSSKSFVYINQNRITAICFSI